MADGEPHVFGDRVYLFGSHDTPGSESFCLEDYEFFSAPLDDLSHWTSRGTNYSAKQDPLYGENACYLYAPDVVRGNDGRYYLYYCLAGWKGKGGYSHPISVAVCNSPDGKYDYYGVVQNPDGTPYMMLDALTKASPENEYIWRWYRNGGDITHARLLHCSKAYRQEMLDIIQTLPVNLEIRCGGTDYLLVHGGPLGYRHRYDDPVRDSVWMRLDETTALPEGKTVIFGHTPTCHYQSDSPMRIYHAADGLYAQNAG